MDITIVIPTKNRPFFVKRCLNYYLDLKFSGNLLIIDSSDDEIANKLKSHIKSIERINVQYVRTIGYPTSVIKENLNHIKTGFAVFHGDDDYLIPASIERCVKYLQNNWDIIAVHGEGIWFRITPDLNRIDEKQGISLYPGPILLEDTPTERLENLSDYPKKPPLFSVCRSDIFRKVFSASLSINECKKHYDRLIMDELVQAGMYAISGQIAKIPGLYLVRVIHDEKDNLRTSWLNNVVLEDRKRAINYFIEKGSYAIMEKQSISAEKAEEACINFLNPILEWQDTGVYKKVNLSGRIVKVGKDIVRAILSYMNLLSLMRKVRGTYIPNNKRLDQLKYFLNPEHIYYDEFIPVYNSITGNVFETSDPKM